MVAFESRSHHHTGDAWGWWPVLLVVCGFYVPAAMWISSAAARGGGRGDLATLAAATVDAGALIGNTLVIAAGGAIVAGVIGTACALVLAAWPTRGARALHVILLLPMLLPTVVLTCAANALFAGTSLRFLVRDLTGAVFLSSVSMAPLVLWGVARALAAMPPAEAAALAMHLAPRTAALRVLLPRAAAPALALTLLAFALLVPRLEIPGYTGVTQVIGYRVLAAFSIGGNDLEGWGWTLAACAPAAIVCVLLGRPLAALGTETPLALARVNRVARRARWSTASGCLWVIALAGCGALVVMAVRAQTALEATLAGYAARELALDSVRALCVSVVVAVCGLRLALWVDATAALHPRRSRVIAWLFLAPMLLPGSVPGLALAGEAQSLLSTELLRWPVLMSLAQAVRFAGLAYLLGWLALRSVPAAERAAAQLLPPATRRARVLGPRAAGLGLGFSTLLLFALMAGEVESAVLLSPPGYVSPAVEVHQLLHFRADEQAFLFASALALIGIVVAVVANRLGVER
ncbi:MAG: hypothetical protein ACKVX7_19620 [Planctomycetota bacterium]